MIHQNNAQSINTTTPPLYSNAKGNLLSTWIITIVLVPLAYLIMTRGVQQANNDGVLLLLGGIVLLSIFFLFSAIKRTINWLYFGKTPLYLDPSPGSVGGEVGGSIILNKHYKEGTKFKIILSNVYFYTTHERDSDGKRKQKVHYETVWEEEGYGKLLLEESQTAVQFLFKVPNNAEATKDGSEKGYYWNVEIKLEEYRYTFNRKFDIPVSKRKQNSKKLTMDVLNVKTKVQSKEIALEAIPVVEEDGATIITYPIFHFDTVAKGLFIFGGFFLGLGIAILVYADVGLGSFVGGMFSIIGSGIVSKGIEVWFVERRIVITDEELRAQRTLFGIIISDISMTRDEKINLSIVGLFGGKIKKKRHEKYAQIIAEQGDKKIYLAPYISSISKQKHLKKYFYSKLKYDGKEDK